MTEEQNVGGEMTGTQRLATVETAAVSVGGAVFTLPRPNRHHNILWWLAALGVRADHTHNQGFVLSTGFYVDRKTAADIALASGQVTRLTAPPNLYSEDLWSGGADLPSADDIRALSTSKAQLQEEKAQLQLIDERDRAEGALAKAHFLVAGRYPQWSNEFGYADALENIEEMMLHLLQPKSGSQAPPADVVEESPAPGWLKADTERAVARLAEWSGRSPDREKIARLIDPGAWATLREIAAAKGLDVDKVPPSISLGSVDTPRHEREDGRQDSLTKADAIISTFTSDRVEEGQMTTRIDRREPDGGGIPHWFVSVYRKKFPGNIWLARTFDSPGEAERYANSVEYPVSDRAGIPAGAIAAVIEAQQIITDQYGSWECVPRAALEPKP